MECLGHPKPSVRALIHTVHVPLGVDAPAGAHADDAISPRLRLDVRGELREKALRLGAIRGRGRRGPRDAVLALVEVSRGLHVAVRIADALVRMRSKPLGELHADQHENACVGSGLEHRGGLVAECGKVIGAGRLLVFRRTQVELVDGDSEIGHLRDRLLAVGAVDSALVEDRLEERSVDRDLRHAVCIDDLRVGCPSRIPGTSRPSRSSRLRRRLCGALLLRRAVVHIRSDVSCYVRPCVADFRRSAPGRIVIVGRLPVAGRRAVSYLESLRVAVDDDVSSVRKLDVAAENDSRLAHVVRREHREDVAPFTQAVAVDDFVARVGRTVHPIVRAVVDVHLD